MATIDLTMDNFEDTIRDNAMVFVDFWADWCGPCKTFAPVFQNASDSHPDIAFAKCDTEQERDLATQFGIRSIPTLVIFREGILLFSQSGALAESILEEIIAKVREMDMDEVRARIAEREAENTAH